MNTIIIDNIKHGEPEIWKPLIDYEQYYQISSWGKMMRISTKKLLKQTLCGDYPSYGVCANSKLKMLTIHRQLAIHFIENPNPDLYNEINHKDGNKRNYALSNLEWSNASLNTAHAYKHKLINKNKPVRQICPQTNRLIKVHPSINAAALEVGIKSGSPITSALRGRYLTSGGFKWEYELPKHKANINP